MFHFPIHSDYTTANYEKTGSVLNKTSAGFLENLNAKLAEQRLSGKAFAVRNLINSKALVSKFITSFFTFLLFYFHTLHQYPLYLFQFLYFHIKGSRMNLLI